MDIFPWSDSEDDMTCQSQEDVIMGVSPSSCATASTQLPSSPGSASDGAWDSTADLDQRLVSETLVASKILWHCVGVINAVRQENGGNSLCVFKIGLTANPLQRRASYFEQNFHSFVVIHKVCRPDLLGMLEMLEAALIAEFYDDERCCRNRQLGGESMRTKDFVPRFPVCILCSYKCCTARTHLRMMYVMHLLFMFPAVHVCIHTDERATWISKECCLQIAKAWTYWARVRTYHL